MKNIVLTGLSGSGKTTLGRLCAEALGMRFFDMDAAIEAQEGVPIREIFAAQGEPAFRALEAETARQTASMTNTVISTGGGAVLRDDNIRALRANGFLIFLDRPVEQILTDLKTAARPLLADGADELRAMEAARRPRYLDTADAVFPNTGGRDHAAKALTALIRFFFPGSGYAVIGDPIAHSLSPAIHAAAFRQLGIPDNYAPIHVPRGHLPQFLERARASGLKGFNITAPHKQDLLPLLDEIDREARLCGAVNTVVRRDKKWIGYNTDMPGLLLSLEQHGGYRNRGVAILGTGGAASGVALKAALEQAAQITVLGRRPEAAAALAHTVEQATGYPVKSGGMGDLPETLRTADLLISAIPVGMTGVGGALPSYDFLDAMPARGLVCDLIYSPPKTALLQAAESRGLQILGGLGMLLNQAIIAEEHFLGQTFNRAALLAAMTAVIKEREQ